jgi:hypothetical protein
MDIDHADTNTPGWFPHRTAAAKIILNNMTEVQKTKLRNKAQEFADKGLPVEVQRK